MKKTISDKVYNLKQLGFGSFSTVYQDKNNPDMVYIFVDTSKGEIDYSKDLMSNFMQDDNYFPVLDCVDYQDYYTVYQSKRYYKITSKSVNYQLVKSLIKLWENFSVEGFKKLSSYEINCKFLELLQSIGFNPDMLESLERLNSNAINYDDCYSFDFSINNIMEDLSGNIIFNDIIFNKKALACLFN